MSNWHRDRNLLKGDYTDTFPLWIHPWVSGIYALANSGRASNDDERIPALLTAYTDELGEATLMMHVLDYRQMEGGDIEWCHWTAVRWRGDKSVSLYGRVADEGWRLDRVMDLPLTESQHQQLVLNCPDFSGWPRSVAVALLPYLPLAAQLSIWDGKEPLYCCHDYLDEFRDEPFVADVLKFEVIPLQETKKWPRQSDDDRTLVLTNPLGPVSDYPSREFIRAIMTETEARLKAPSTPQKVKSKRTPKSKKRNNKR